MAPPPYAVKPVKQLGPDGGEEQIHKIRITLTSKNVKTIEKGRVDSIHVAIQSRNRFIAKVLLVNGADKNRRTKDGRTHMDLNFCYGKDFKSFHLAKLLKIMPANRDF